MVSDILGFVKVFQLDKVELKNSLISLLKYLHLTSTL